MGDIVVVRVHHHQGVDVVAFALGLGPDLLGFCDRGEAGREVRPRNCGVRIVHQRERDAPICHGACGISLDGLLKDLLGVDVPEGMLIPHRAIEATLRNFVARGLEVHVTELLIHIVLRDQWLRC